jgi:hypothetical protein
VTRTRVPCETNALSTKGQQEPNLTRVEMARVNDVLRWAQKHDLCMFYSVLASVSRLMEFIYVPTAHVAVRLREETLRIPVNPGPPVANT